MRPTDPLKGSNTPCRFFWIIIKRQIGRSGQFEIYIHLNPRQVFISEKGSCNLVPILVNLRCSIEDHLSLARKVIH
jgi:hypothetical protein